MRALLLALTACAATRSVSSTGSGSEPVPLPLPLPLPDPSPRDLTGSRDDRDPLTFALAITSHTADDLSACTTLPPTAPIAVGDLLTFPNLTAAAIAIDDRGVVEMLYLANGIVRRGFLDPARPRTKRDDDGRIVNTFVRHDHDEPPAGHKDLAGEMLEHVVRLSPAQTARAR